MTPAAPGAEHKPLVAVHCRGTEEEADFSAENGQVCWVCKCCGSAAITTVEKRAAVGRGYGENGYHMVLGWRKLLQCGGVPEDHDAGGVDAMDGGGRGGGGARVGPRIPHWV